MYYNKDIEDVLKELNTTEKGLTQKEAAKRLKIYGENKLPEPKRKSVVALFFDEFKDPIIILLLVSVIVSFISSEIIDAIAILAIILVDIIMETYQENKANNTALALNKLVAVTTKVLRDNKVIEIDSSLLTVGDCIILDSGDKISADARIIECKNALVNESTLTGESTLVSKDNKKIVGDDIDFNSQTNMLFAGTYFIKGRVKAIVTKTASNTEVGKIATHLHNTVEEKSPLTIRVEKFSKQISLLVLVIAFIITMLLIIKGESIEQIFLAVVALSVSAMPEGLPLALTMALSIASNRLVNKKVVVKKLKSVESLGSCTVIASDKTGTLTVNEQTAKKILLPNGYSYDIGGVGYKAIGEVTGNDLLEAKKIAFLGMINNEASIVGQKRSGDSIDIAFLVLAKKLKIEKEKVNILSEIPYESEKQCSAVFYEYDNKVYCTVKGSLEVVKEFCSKMYLNDALIKSKHLDKQNEELAKDGYRVIAIANGIVDKKDEYTLDDINNLIFMGMVGFIDPIRTDVLEAINECENAGIKVLMITGDHPLTAFSIARELGLTNNYEEVATSNEVNEYLKKGKGHFDKWILGKKVFTRVTPMQKYEIINSLKRQGEFVAVTGDGVNDALALKSANIGVCMGDGEQLAKETSKMIILDNHFKSIVLGIKEGRIAYANIRKIIYFLLSCGLAEVLFFCLAIFADLPMPLIAIQLLWLNVVTDGIQDFALSFEKGENNIMKMPPRNPKEPLFDKKLFGEIIYFGIIIGLIVFGVWYYLIEYLNMDLFRARSYIMTLMVFIQNIHVFNCRSEKQSFLKIPLLSNKIILYGVICSIGLHLLVLYLPVFQVLLQIESIPLKDLTILFGIGLLILVIGEIYKNICHYLEQRK